MLKSLATLLSLASLLSAQQVPVPTLRTSTSLVVVDLSAEDKSGHPIRNLKPSDLRLTESGTPQVIRSLDEFDAVADPPQPLHLTALPPGYFLDYDPVPPSAVLNVVLIDFLNTPLEDQARVRQQLNLFIAQLHPGARIAVFGLASRLFLLQGFTSDPAMLQKALRAAPLSRKSPIPLQSTAADQGDQLDASSVLTSANNTAPEGDRTLQILRQFDAESRANQTRLRVQLTLDAFTVLTRYLAQFPGRKNLIWFSGSFPSEIVPDPALADPFGISQLDPHQFRQTINLLTRAQVAVYPIDARGLSVQSAFSVTGDTTTQASPRLSSTARTGIINDPTVDDSAITRFNNEEVTRHATMQALASATGGRAYFNGNDLGSAVASAIKAGADFYTLTYHSSDTRQNGAYRPIHLAPAPGSPLNGAHLRYRLGYFADQPVAGSQAGQLPVDSAAVSTSSSLQRIADRYTESIMARGAPTPGEILFEARVLPAAGAATSTLVPGNRPNPRRKLTGPYRAYVIDVVSMTKQFTLVPAGPDHPQDRVGAAELLAYLYDTEGNLILLDGRTIRFNVTPQSMSAFLAAPLHLTLKLSSPERAHTVLRLAVRDIPTNHSGVIELSTTELNALPPALPAPN